MPKSFERVAAIPKKKERSKLKVVPNTSKKVVNLNQVDLNDRENWLRALNICKASDNSSFETMMSEIEQYQGQIDQALRTAQAQSTIYAYAIGTRLDAIEERQFYIDKGYENLTSFIKAGEIRRPNGESITTRQVWAYRSVTRGLNEFLEVAEAIRDGKEVTSEVHEYLERLSTQLNQDIVESFLQSYAETITSVLELGVSKLEQVYRLPQPMAVSGLLAGILKFEDDIVEVNDISFSKLRKAISGHENKRKKGPIKKKSIDPEQAIYNISEAVKELKNVHLSSSQKRKVKSLAQKLNKLINV